jgi:hypothetical protein
MYPNMNIVHVGIPAAFAVGKALTGIWQESCAGKKQNHVGLSVYFTGPKSGQFDWIVVERGNLAQAAEKRFKGAAGIPICYSGDVELLSVGERKGPIPRFRSLTDKSASSFIAEHGGEKALAVLTREKLPNLFNALTALCLEDPVQYGFSVGLADVDGQTRDALHRLETEKRRMHLPPYLKAGFVKKHIGKYTPWRSMASFDTQILEGAKQFGRKLITTFQNPPDYPEYQTSRNAIESARQVFEGKKDPSLSECFMHLRSMMASLFRVDVPDDDEFDLMRSGAIPPSARSVPSEPSFRDDFGDDDDWGE